MIGPTGKHFFVNHQLKMKTWEDPRKSHRRAALFSGPHGGDVLSPEGGEIRQAFLELLDEGISVLHTLRAIKTAPVTEGIIPEMKNGTLGMTVGRTKDECEVKFVLPGGPAARSRQIARGDVILR